MTRISLKVKINILLAVLMGTESAACHRPC